MKDLLVIRFIEDSNRCEWGISSPQQPMRYGQGSLEELKQAIEPFSQIACHCFLPSETATVVTAELPNTSKAAYSGIPFQIEELISNPIEDNHIAYYPERSLSPEVLVCDRQKLSTWIEALETLDIDLKLLSIDCFLLPISEETLYIEDQRVISFTTDFKGAIPISLFEHMQSQSDSENLNIQNADDDSNILLASYLESPKGFKPINILVGEFATFSAFEQNKKLLLPPAIVALCTLILWLGSSLYNNHLMEKQIKHIDQQMVQLYKKIYPQARRVINPVGQMRANLREQSGQTNNSAFIPFLSSITPLLAPKELEITSIRYSEDSGVMRIILQASSFPPLETLREKLKTVSTTAQLGDLTQTENGVNGTLIINSPSKGEAQ
ncbi:type II secretion system protein GspL [Neptuniibacter sp. PT8_73]|uniref:type II secretion system protein GspL n=1 Tax=Neptuniibacter sp. PT8_73 TaxID=3398206 RepID=UPI0039F49732